MADAEIRDRRYEVGLPANQICNLNFQGDNDVSNPGIGISAFTPATALDELKG